MNSHSANTTASTDSLTPHVLPGDQSRGSDKRIQTTETCFQVLPSTPARTLQPLNLSESQSPRESGRKMIMYIDGDTDSKIFSNVKMRTMLLWPESQREFLDMQVPAIPGPTLLDVTQLVIF